jgi:hypothetical protein
MVKMALNIAVFGAFVLIVAVLGFFLWQTLFASEKYSYGQENAEPAYSEQQAGNENALRSSASPRSSSPTDQAIAEYTKWLAIFTLFLVLATIGLFISGERNVQVARRSADAAKQSADAARDAVILAQENAERQLRAYVFLDKDQIVETLRIAVGEVPSGMFRFTNFGLTPANNLAVHITSGTGPWPLPPDIKLPFPENLPKGIQVAPPGAVTLWPLEPQGNPVPAEDFEQIRIGKSRFYIWGRATYTDAFGKDRYTNFCLATVPPADPRSSSGYGFIRCSIHNDYK